MTRKSRKNREKILKKTAHQYNSNSLNSKKKTHDVHNNSRYHFAANKKCELFCFYFVVRHTPASYERIQGLVSIEN